MITFSRIAFLLISIGLLSGCINSIDSRLPLNSLEEITLNSDFNLVASPNHPTANLPGLLLPPGARLRVIGANSSYNYLLTLYDNRLGWMPSFFSREGTGRIEAPVVIEPLDGACTVYQGATLAPEEPWISPSAGSVIVEGSIYRPQAGGGFDDAQLTAVVSGGGRAVASEYVHLQLTRSSAVVFFAYSIEDVRQGSRVSFELGNTGQEPVYFQATFYADNCGDSWAGSDYTAQLPIGQPKQEVQTPPPTPTPRTPVTPTPTPTGPPPIVTIEVTSGIPVNPATRQEIQELVDRWDRIHHEVDRSLDPTDLPLVLTGGALRQQEDTLRALRANNCYWEFRDLAPSQIVGWQEISVNEVIVTMEKHWDAKLYCRGRLDQRSSFDEPFQVRYQIIRTNQGWRIAEKVPLDSAENLPAPRAPVPAPAPPPSSGSSRTVCANTYPTRLQTGTQAWLDSSSRNNVRSGPGTSNRVVGQLQPGEEVSIVDGPSCAQGMVWWYVQNSRLSGWSSEGTNSAYWLVPVGLTRNPTATPVPSPGEDPLRASLLSKSRNSSVGLNHRDAATQFVDSLLWRMDDFYLPGEGITANSMRDALYRNDAGDRLNGILQEIWSDWLSNASAQRVDPWRAEPFSWLSPFRQTVIRMAQGRQGRLSSAQQRALYSLFTRSENSTVWYSNVDGVIGALNREFF